MNSGGKFVNYFRRTMESVEIDLYDVVKVNYAKFGDIVVEV